MKTSTAVLHPLRYAIVPKLCPGGTVVCFAGGPSLTREDVEYCRTRVDGAVAVNTAYQLAEWATALYAADWIWWQWHRGAPTFPGLKYTLTRQSTRWPGVQLLKKTGDEGLELKPDGLRTGRNGGYQAINLAVHLGAKRIILLGYDMQKGPKGESHWHGDHPRHTESPYGIFVRKFDTIVKPLAAAGVSVVNCSRHSALKCFPKADLAEVLP
jgi:hypothetical protein